MRDTHATRIGNVALKEAIKRAGIDPRIIDHVHFGCCMEPADACNVAGDNALAAYVYTLDLKKAFALFEGLHFGIVGINDINPTSTAAPFGGMKESGLVAKGCWKESTNISKRINKAVQAGERLTVVGIVG